MTIPPNCTQAIFELKMKGWQPIIAHPERYRNLNDVDDADEWRSVGGLLQMNAGSLLGRYGQTAEKLAWGLLERGWIDYISTDYHARGRVPTAESRAMLEAKGGAEIAALLFDANPARMLRDEDPEAVPPLEIKRSVWQRLLGKR